MFTPLLRFGSHRTPFAVWLLRLRLYTPGYLCRFYHVPVTRSAPRFVRGWLRWFIYLVAVTVTVTRLRFVATAVTFYGYVPAVPAPPPLRCCRLYTLLRARSPAGCYVTFTVTRLRLRLGCPRSFTHVPLHTPPVTRLRITCVYRGLITDYGCCGSRIRILRLLVVRCALPHTAPTHAVTVCCLPPHCHAACRFTHIPMPLRFWITFFCYHHCSCVIYRTHVCYGYGSGSARLHRTVRFTRITGSARFSAVTGLHHTAVTVHLRYAYAVCGYRLYIHTRILVTVATLYRFATFDSPVTLVAITPPRCRFLVTHTWLRFTHHVTHARLLHCRFTWFALPLHIPVAGYPPYAPHVAFAVGSRLLPVYAHTRILHGLRTRSYGLHTTFTRFVVLPRSSTVLRLDAVPFAVYGYYAFWFAPRTFVYHIRVLPFFTRLHTTTHTLRLHTIYRSLPAGYRSPTTVVYVRLHTLRSAHTTHTVGYVYCLRLLRLLHVTYTLPHTAFTFVTVTLRVWFVYVCGSRLRFCPLLVQFYTDTQFILDLLVTPVLPFFVWLHWLPFYAFAFTFGCVWFAVPLHTVTHALPFFGCTHALRNTYTCRIAIYTHTHCCTVLRLLLPPLQLLVGGLHTRSSHGYRARFAWLLPFWITPATCCHCRILDYHVAVTHTVLRAGYTARCRCHTFGLPVAALVAWFTTHYYTFAFAAPRVLRGSPHITFCTAYAVISRAFYRGLPLPRLFAVCSLHGCWLLPHV